MKKLKYFLVFLVFCSSFSCKENDDETKIVQVSYLGCGKTENRSGRMLGLDFLNLTETGTFEENILLAKQLKTNFLALHLNWNQIEASANSFTDPGDALFLLNQTAEANNMKFSLTIRPIDLTGKFVPQDLMNKRFSDSLMINRFKNLVDFVLTRVNSNTLLNFQIGNEIDGYNTSNELSTFWDDYGVFLSEIKTYIHSKNSQVKVGFTGTLFGLNKLKSIFTQLIPHVDLLGVTYYPIASNFDVLPPNNLTQDFNLLTSNFPNIPISVQELGYQTSATCNSSQELQADFFCTFFEYWDTKIDRIKTMNIVRLNDLSTTEAQNSALPYGITDQKFIEYLKTLGIRTYSGKGENKKAFQTLKENIESRGW